MCCGQKRSTLTNTRSPARARSVSQSLPANWQGPRTQPLSLPQTGATSAYVGISPSSSGVQFPTALTAQDSIAIRYLETDSVRVQGLASGRRYEFSPARSVQQVDARDASSLLNTRFFTRA